MPARSCRRAMPRANHRARSQGRRADGGCREVRRSKSAARAGNGAPARLRVRAASMKTRRMNYADAMADALRLCFKEDPHFTVIGNEVFGIGPQRVQFEPLQAEFPDRIYFPPTSEAAFAALAAGAAMCGHRTFAHLGVASFTYPAVSSIANEVATI